ncbi:hypothetical protein XENOCAPTIV_017331 [Xenoophorus captivus]|uniref:Transmembrane protein n=1 Tax=Xenoophorus captivus TaxID=1517983 RepID=A0ABV0S7H3_9TELE
MHTVKEKERRGNVKRTKACVRKRKIFTFLDENACLRKRKNKIYTFLDENACVRKRKKKIDIFLLLFLILSGSVLHSQMHHASLFTTFELIAGTHSDLFNTAPQTHCFCLQSIQR